jgi:hypothetical protein
MGPARADSPYTVTCRHDIRVPVALSPGQPAINSVSGELCSTPGERRAGATVQLLIAGSTYTHSHWDFGTIDGTDYSYARCVAAGGFPTFAIDPIGSGASSRPRAPR